MSIQILSDLHLEHTPSSDLQTSLAASSGAYDYEVPVCAEYLALLGDTGRTCETRLFHWLDIQLTKFRIVFYLSGNNGKRNVIPATQASLKVFTSFSFNRASRILARKLFRYIACCLTRAQQTDLSH